MTNPRNIPARAELTVLKSDRLNPELVGLELGVSVVDSQKQAVANWRFKISNGVEEIMDGETDGNGNYKGNLVRPISEGTQERLFLVLQESPVSDWKDVPPPAPIIEAKTAENPIIPVVAREDAAKQKQRTEDICKNGGSIRAGETIVLERGIYSINPWRISESLITIEAGGTFIIRSGVEITSGIVFQVEPNGTLIIEPGVVIKFLEQGGIRCRGVLKAEGTKQEPIGFTTGFPPVGYEQHNDGSIDKRWKGVTLEGEGTAGSRISNCVIEYAKGGYGGGLSVMRAPDLEITDSVLQNNQAENGGGMACQLSRVKIKGVKVVGNKASKNGGGVYVQCGDVQIEDSEIDGNGATCGGGIAVYNGWEANRFGILTEGFRQFKFVLNEGTIANNGAVLEGGGVWIETVKSGPSLTAEINRSKFIGNVLQRGDNPISRLVSFKRGTWKKTPWQVKLGILININPNFLDQFNILTCSKRGIDIYLSVEHADKVDLSDCKFSPAPAVISKTGASSGRAEGRNMNYWYIYSHKLVTAGGRGHVFLKNPKEGNIGLYNTNVPEDSMSDDEYIRKISRELGYDQDPIQNGDLDKDV